jgi:hypothetical protein
LVRLIDLLYFSSANFELHHAGGVDGADRLDLIVADIGMSLEQLPRIFKHGQAGHEIAWRCYKRVNYAK